MSAVKALLWAASKAGSGGTMVSWATISPAGDVSSIWDHCPSRARASAAVVGRVPSPGEAARADFRDRAKITSETLA